MTPKNIKFIGIGAPKSGTSWLWEMLRQHPDIFLPDKKELHYFNIEAMGNSEYENPNFFKPETFYLKQFEAASANQVCGEITPAYLVSKSAPNKIFSFNKEVKLIALIRNPIDRAYSDYLYRKQMGWISANMSFADAYMKFPEILTCSLYGADIDRYLEMFPQENLLIIFQEDIKTNAALLLKTVQKFIGVKEHLPHNLGMRSNETGEAKYPWLNRTSGVLQNLLRKYHMNSLLESLKSLWIGHKLKGYIYQSAPFNKKTQLEASERMMLREYFSKDIAKVEKLTGRNLQHWKIDAA